MTILADPDINQGTSDLSFSRSPKIPLGAIWAFRTKIFVNGK